MALSFLGKAINDREREKHQRRLAAFQDAVSGGPISFLRKDTALVAGPEIHTARCSGLGASHDKACVTTWQAWAAQVLPSVTDEG
jgi:hypothetical protein